MKRNFSKRIKASVVSLVLAATAIPAAFSATVNAVVSSDIAVSSETNAISSLKKDDVYLGYTADLVKSGMNKVTFAITADYTGNFSYGFGIGVAEDPYWYEWNGKSWVDTKGGTVTVPGTSVAVTKGETTYITIDTSSLILSYNPSSDQYPGKFEFRCYYAGESNGTISINSVKANDSSAPTTPTTPDKPPTVITPKNRTSGQWSFEEHKADRTATISTTLSKEVEFETPMKLTKGYDEDYYAENPDDTSGLTNACKLSYADFGITDMEGITIESITATIKIPDDVKVEKFMYGGGLNVEYASDADTEYAKTQAGVKEGGGYWYNDMGEAEVAELGVDFPITPKGGVTLENPGNYIEALWEVPAEVQPYAEVMNGKAISFQFWYAQEDVSEVEGVDYREITECDLISMAITYTKEVTVPYTGSIAKTLNNAVVDHTDTAKNSYAVDYADLGVEEDSYISAVKFKVSASSDIDKLVFCPGTSVTEDAVGMDYWYQEPNDYRVLNAGDQVEFMWIMPPTIRGTGELQNFVDETGKIQLGYYYGATDAINIDNIEVYYSDYQLATTTSTTTTSTTTTTTTTTTTAKTTTTSTTTSTPVTTTTTTEPLKATLWGDANVDGFVTISDAVKVLSYVSNAEKSPLSPQGIVNADVFNNGDGLSGEDSLSIQKKIANVIADLPESYM